MTDDPIAEYRRRGWELVPIPTGAKGPRISGWQARRFAPGDFGPGGNVGVILGPRSGELVDIDLDCAEAIALADTYLPPTRAEFGRASKLRAHRLYVAPGAHYESFGDPLLYGKNTILELRAGGQDGGAHQTVFPPSTHPSGEQIEWHRDIIAPAVFDAARLRRRCAYLAIGCLTSRYVSRTAADRPGPDLPRLLWEADHALGHAAFRWLGQPHPDSPRRDHCPRRDLSHTEFDLAELVAEIPNDADRETWNSIGLAIYAASGGSDQGGIVFDTWSAKSPKYNPYTTAERWQHFRRSPPNRTGLGKLIKLALEAGWRPADREIAVGRRAR